MEAQKRDRVSRGGRTRAELVIEDQPVRSDAVAEMKRVIAVGHEVDELAIVSGGEYDVPPGRARTADELEEYGLPGSDTLHRIRAAKQFIQQE